MRQQPIKCNSSISKRLKSDDSQTNDINEYDFTNLKDYVDSKVPNEINFKIPFMKDAELTNALQSLNTKKSTGLDGLSPKILKLSARIIGPSLLKMINYSINSGIFPDNLKIARLIPIHKGGPKDDPSNFRPISILSVISKLLEKHITKHLFAYLNKYDILHKSQSGFRKHHSCNTALINLVDKWLSNIDKGEVVGAIFYDLKKAFDIVNHELLIKKLGYYKFDINTLNWIKSYLTDRKQCIIDKQTKSSLRTVNAGVPQGSVLGPALFLLFINDLPLFINEAYLDFYADDSIVHTSNKQQLKVQNDLQQGSDNFENWCSKNDMLLHLKKTCCMSIGTRQLLAKIDSLDLHIKNEQIKAVDSQKLLGIIIDKSLTWDKQIDAVCLNVTRRITLLKLLSKYVDQNSLKLYYKSYILPILDYGCLIWGRCSTSNTNRLIKLQKRAARKILKVDLMTPSTQMFSELKWLPFPERVKYHTHVMMYKILNNMAPDYLRQLFHNVSETHERALRSADNELLTTPLCRTTYYEKSFTVTGAREWNSLPLNLRKLPTIQSFKTAVKSYLLNK